MDEEFIKKFNKMYRLASNNSTMISSIKTPKNKRGGILNTLRKKQSNKRDNMAKILTARKTSISNFLESSITHDYSMVTNNLDNLNPIIKESDIQTASKNNSLEEEKEFDNFIEYLSPNGTPSLTPF